MLQKYRTIISLSVIIFAMGSAMPIYSQVNARNDTTTCDGTSFLYAVPDGGVWTNTFGGTATIVSPSSQTTDVTGLTPGINTFTYTLGIYTDNVVITSNMVTANAGADRTASCLTTAVLTGNPIPSGGTGLWALKYPGPGVTISTPNSNSTNLSGLPFGNTIFTWTISANGCTAIDEVSINSNTPENNDGTNQSACTNIFYIEGETPPIGGSGLWTEISSPGTIVFNSTTIPGVQIIAPIGQSTVRWTVTYAGCPSSKDFIIQNNLPNPQAGSDQQLCSNSTILNATPPVGVEIGTWSIIAPQTEIISNINNYNASVSNLKQGITTFVWTIDNGICIKSDDLQISNNLPSVYAGRDTSICTNTFNLLANNPSSGTGTWTCSPPSVTISNPNSYNSAVSNLTNGTYIFTWTVSNAFCPAIDQVTVNSHYVNITAGTSSEGCTSTLSLNATPIPSGGSGLWSVVNGTATFDNPSTNATTARNINDGVRFRWTINSGTCTYQSDVDYYNQSPTQALTEIDKAVCDNNGTISANAPATLDNETGLWTIEVGQPSVTIDKPSLYQTDISNLDFGGNVFRWTISNNQCSTYDIIIVSNNKILANAGTDENTCFTTHNLNAMLEGGTGYWTTNSPSAIIANSTQPNSAISNLDFGSHSFTWTRTDNGCSASDNVIITNVMATTSFAGQDQNVCDSTAQLNANSPVYGTGVWTRTTGLGIISNPNSNQTSTYALSYGLNSFRWTITRGICSNFDEVNIYNNKITANAGIDQQICNTNTSNISGNQPGAGQTGYWQVTGGSGTLTDQSIYATTVNSLTKGTNTLSWTITDGQCSNSDQMTITNNTPDSAKVASDKSICSNQSDVNAIAVTNGIGIWSVNQGNATITTPNNNNSNVTGLDSGVNIFTWTVTKNGCSLAANQQITNNSVTADIPLDVINICKLTNDTTITALNPGGGSSGIWTKVSSGLGTIESPSSNITRITNLPNGETRFRWTVQNGSCTAQDEIRIINDYYVANAWIVGSDQLCVNYASLYGNQGSGTGTMLWTSNNPLITFSNPSSSSTTVNNLPYGQNTAYWTLSNNGCSAQTSLSLTNNSITTDAGNNIVGCNNTGTLSAQAIVGGQTGNWTANNVSVIFENSLSPTSNISNAPNGTSVLTWTLNSNGCTTTDYMSFTNYSFTITAGNDQTVCNTNANLSGSSPLTGTGYWTVLEGNAVVNNSVNNSTNVSNLSNGNNAFRWTVTRNNCTHSDEVNIVNDLYIADVLLTNPLCVDTAQIRALPIAVGSGAAGTWTVSSGSGIIENSTANETMVTGVALGFNQYTWTVRKGSCTSFRNLTVTNNRLNISAGINQIICDSYTSIYASPLSITGTGLWTGPQGTTISSPSTAGTNLSNIQRGDNIFTWSVVDKGCTASSNVTITLNSFDADAGSDQNIQFNNTTLNASLPDGTATGTWEILTGNGTFTQNNNPATPVNGLIMGVNQFRWNVTWRACSDYDDITIIYNVAEANAGTDKVSCLNTATMSAEAPLYGIGTWSVVQGGGTFLGANNPVSGVTNIPRGVNVYRWTVVAFGITAFDDVSVTNNSFSTYAGPDQATCEDFVYLNAQAPGANGLGYWSILNGYGEGEFDFGNIPNPTVTSIAVGTNMYIWEVQRNGCVTTDTVSILRYQPPTIANAGNDVVLCSSNTAMLNANAPSFGTGRWTSENSQNIFSNTTRFNTTISNLAQGENILWWTISTTHCQSQDEIVISAYNTMEITVQPVSQAVIETGSAVLTVETTGGVQNFQWKKDGLDLYDDDRIIGANSNTISISNFSYGDMGSYTCVITGYCNTITTIDAYLSVYTSLGNIENENLKIYPNPTSGIINLEFINSTNGSDLFITNLNGQKILDKKELNQKEAIDLSKFADGIYFINILSAQGLIREIIIIQK